MSIRTYRPGDEAAQTAIYNAAAAALPSFKPATLIDVQRRTRVPHFDPSTRLYAEVGGKVVGYAAFHPNGRVSYPWVLPGNERWIEPLFEGQLAGLKRLGLRRAFAAYRPDWSGVGDFFLGNGFRRVRDVVGFAVDFHELPTAPAVLPAPASIEPTDVADIFAMAPRLFQVGSADALQDHLFRNPGFGKDSLFGLRRKTDRKLAAAAVLVTDAQYADPRVLDASMPCFRLGAFGTETMQVKRVKGLFSFVAPLDRSLAGLGIELVGMAVSRLQDRDDIESLGAQCPSDVPELLSFYERHFRKQGSFPVFERDLA